MQKLTNAGLTALMIRVLGKSDPDLLDGIDSPDPMNTALVPDATKHVLIERILARHGPGPLLAIGTHFDDVDETPVTTVLTRSPDPGVLADKWMRLERYMHSSHRVHIEPIGLNGWSCTRQSRSGPPPSMGENALVAGLLFGLLTRIGAQGVTLSTGAVTLSRAALPRAALPEGETLAAFRLHWTSARSTPVAVEPSPPAPLPDRLTTLLADDIGRSWKLRDAARALAFSERSLQRRLSADGRSFSSLLRRARMRMATALLTENKASLAEIGYCCGYADQAHFQRDFLRVTNMTPRIFRTLNAS